MATGIALLVLPYIMGGMGAGDVKLMGAVGSFLGAKATLGAFLFIALAGGVYSLAIILIRRDVFKGFFSEKLLVSIQHGDAEAVCTHSNRKFRSKAAPEIRCGDCLWNDNVSFDKSAWNQILHIG